MEHGRADHLRRYRLVTVAVAVAVATIVFAVGAARTAAGASRADACPSLLAGKADLGRLAFVDRGQLRVLQISTCRVRTLVASRVVPPVRWSADGRYLAYGLGSVVSSSGGAPTRPLGQLSVGWAGGSPGWVWSSAGHRLAGVTTHGGVVVGEPGAASRRLLPDGWGATSIAWSPDGQTLAVSRSLYGKARAPSHQEIWLLNLHSGLKTLLFHLTKPDVAPPWLSGFSPDGRWLLAWEDSQNSASLAADGLPLIAIPVNGDKSVLLGRELVYSDFVSWCTNNLLAYVLDNGGRQVTLNDRINFAGPPPHWHVITPADPGDKAHLSFISPACSPSKLHMVVAAAGPAEQDEPFGHEHRRIWLLPYTGGNWRPLELTPPKDTSDELPLWSRDGRWIAFIRTTWTGNTGVGRLYLFDIGAHFSRQARTVGPIANLGVAGTSLRFGFVGNYYGHYDWAAQIAWYS